MVTNEKAREIALALPDSLELPHFELTSFRVNTCPEHSKSKKNKNGRREKIFATMHESKNLMCLMLTPIDQSVFCAFDKEVMHPVPNKWGQKGATYVNLKKVKLAMLKDAMKQAYKNKLKK